MTTNSQSKSVTVLSGDGVGPEVMEAAIKLVDATGAKIDWDYQLAGQKAFDSGILTGVTNDALDSISKNKFVLKSPLATPIGHGQKSANVTLRKMFETYANIRPARELPGIEGPFSGRGIDLTVIRENVEDLYAGIENMQTPNVAQCLKLITRLGSQKVSRAAFAYAKAEGYKKVTVATKANIMKLTEGMLKREFEKVANEHPEFTTNHVLIDNAAHQLVVRPEDYQVIVTSNMNGDILSDLASGLVGGLGVAPSANVGNEVQIFEAVHGTAPDIAGKDLANPTAMILSAVMLLRGLNLPAKASALESALYRTLEEGYKTRDLSPGSEIGCKEFTDLVGERIDLSNTPEPQYRSIELSNLTPNEAQTYPDNREQWGVDIFLESVSSPNELGANLSALAEKSGFELVMISNRGTSVWPEAKYLPALVDHFRCRFKQTENTDLNLLIGSVGEHYRWMHIEKLEMYDGEEGFTMAQGQK